MTEPFLGEIKLFSYDWAPKFWALCDGATLPIKQNQALYSLLGNQFGQGNPETFTLPDLRGRVPVAPDDNRSNGYQAGVEDVVLTNLEMAAHTHSFMVVDTAANSFANLDNYMIATATNQPGKPEQAAFYDGPPNTSLANSTCNSVGGNLSHTNVQPTAVVNYCIALAGTYPQRD